MKPSLCCLLASILCCTTILAEALEEKDNSKPTNVYSQVDNYFEYTETADAKLYGYHPKLNYAPDDSQLFLLEVPYLYNTRTKKSGIRDLRFRYFNVPYRDYSKTLGALGFSIDTYIPVGNAQDGLGSGSWTVNPGVMLGIIASDDARLSFFPTIAYAYTSKSKDPNYGQQNDSHGFNFQVLGSYKINDASFIQVTPIFEFNNFNNIHDSGQQIEVEYVHDILKGKYQTGFMFRKSFNEPDLTFRLNFTVFL